MPEEEDNCSTPWIKTPLRIPNATALYKEAVSLTFPGLAMGRDLSDRGSVSSATTLYTVWYDSVTGKNRRSSAADAYLWAPGQQRETLTVLATHKVDKILFDENVTATGVRFLPTNGSSLPATFFKAYARKGVVLSTGSLASAPILERSGIGGSAVLKAAGVSQLVDLPGVGANLNVSSSSLLRHKHVFLQLPRRTNRVRGHMLYLPRHIRTTPGSSTIEISSPRKSPLLTSISYG